MNLEKSLKEIKEFLLERYGDNLAAVLVFGSANTGEWKEGVSDIDCVIILKKSLTEDIEKENKFLWKKFLKYKFNVPYFLTIKDYEYHLYKKGSWPHWIMLISGSKRVYVSKEFSQFRKKLVENPVSKDKILKYLKMKDWRISHIYPQSRKGFSLTKGLFANLRMRMQIMVYFKYDKLVFDYHKCLARLKFSKEEETALKRLHDYYGVRKSLTKREFKFYKDLTKKFTRRIRFI